MDNISDIKITDCENSIYAKPSRMIFKQNGKTRDWDLMKVHDSVAIVIHNITRKKLVFVKQFRPAVYINRVELDGDTVNTDKYPGSIGVTTELCAGIVDKDITLAEVAREEILEECGYDVPIERIEKVNSYCSGVGLTGSLQTLFYAEVTDEMKTGAGGGLADEGEYIEVVEVSLNEARRMIFDESIPRPLSFLFACMWFFDIKLPSLKLQQKL